MQTKLKKQSKIEKNKRNNTNSSYCNYCSINYLSNNKYKCSFRRKWFDKTSGKS